MLDPERGRVDIVRGSALPAVKKVGVWGLPLLSALLGVWITWRRRI